MNVFGWLMTVAVFLSLSIGRALAGETATAVATTTAGFVTAIKVTSGGSGYTSEPSVTLSGGGGNGATAKAILSGDKVVGVVVLIAGNGYSTAPAVLFGAPTKALGVRLELVPKLTVEGPAGKRNAQVQSAASLSGPWTMWTNVTVGADGVVLVDLSPGSAARFYRALAEQSSAGPTGFVWIAPGTFVMGSPESEADRNSDEVQHTVTLTQGFWMSDHETTQAEYQLVMGSNPSYFTGDLNRPVEMVSWDDAVAYCKKLTERERAAGRITAQQAYRLPTESEWEYAARGGTTGARYGWLDSIAWNPNNSNNPTYPVKGKTANAWGLHDMIGNVWEWCADWYGAYPTGSVTNPIGPNSGFGRVIRGGSWSAGSGLGRSVADRADFSLRTLVLGFRPALSSAPTVMLEAPPKPLGVRLELVPNLTVEGPAGSAAQVQSAESLTGPWTSWTSVTVGAQGTVLVDLSPGSAALFYRVLAEQGPTGFVWIAPGTFVMGSPVSEAGRYSDEVQHTVTLTQGFWLSDHETTQAEYEAVMGSNPSNWKGESLPVEYVAWNDAVAYCQKLTERERAAGRITAQQAYRLPTEAEWEYAARAGTMGARYEDLDAIAWHGGNSGSQMHSVKGKTANAWGLHDMIGNVSEWCADWYGAYPTGSVTDPPGPEIGSLKVHRGGAWDYGRRGSRSAFRYWLVPGFRGGFGLGFRPALSTVR